MKKSRALFAAAALVVGLSISSLAFAATKATHPSDPSFARALSSQMIQACDQQVDGHRVRAWYDTNISGGDSYTYSAWAPSGGCSEPQGTTWGAGMRDFRICVEAEGCGPWFRYG